MPHLRLGVGEGVQLAYVVPRRDEPELQGALLQAPEGEPREAEVPLDVAEDRLDVGRPAFFELLAPFGVEE